MIILKKKMNSILFLILVTRYNFDYKTIILPSIISFYIISMPSNQKNSVTENLQTSSKQTVSKPNGSLFIYEYYRIR